MEKPVIGVIFGGKSMEYEVSLASACSVLEEFDGERYEIVKIGITRQGKWYLYEGENEKILNDTWQNDGSLKEISIDINNGTFLAEGKRLKIDKILPILHGDYGEDGRIQSLFEIMNQSYSGCDAFSSFISIDKDVTKKIARDVGVMVTPGITVYRGEEKDEKIYSKIRKIGYPVVVKPSNSGSSVGVEIAKNRHQARAALERALKISKKALVERKIEGKEVEISVLDMGEATYFSTVGELKYTGELYSYDEKYKNGKTEYIIPAKIPCKAEKKIKTYAKKLYKALGIRDLCRMDFFVDRKGKVYFNEVNTMPGFTKISMFPKLLLNDGIAYADIINNILNIK